jgi:1,4-dihydroxy-6-naphthoate synthase
LDKITLNFGFSSCPNDTFAFHALVHGLVQGPTVEPFIDDIEALNERAEQGAAEVTKISAAAFSRICGRYALLRAGAVAGFGVGPIVVARSARPVGGRVAVPGARTTAALLLRLLGCFETVPMRFDQIEDAVLDGKADCGVLIHEGRFTYEGRGLSLLADLGVMWEARMHCPVPLAAIAVRRDLAPDLARRMESAIRASVSYAMRNPDASRAYVAAYAKEMAPDVVERHIGLYVNDYTLDVDEASFRTFVRWGSEEGVFADVPEEAAIFI